jgi:hypothetical protein
MTPDEIDEKLLIDARNTLTWEPPKDGDLLLFMHLQRFARAVLAAAARSHKDTLELGRKQEIIDRLIAEVQEKFEESTVGKELVAYRLLELEFPIITELRAEADRRQKEVERALAEEHNNR